MLAERGVYLPEQVYEEWATPKRDYLMGLLRDCVQRWTALLRQAGHVDEAILRLRAYWLEHLTDEDALRPLLEVLGERERFQEAEECYAKTRAVLAKDGHRPDERTNEASEAVRALKVQRIAPLQHTVSTDAILNDEQVVLRGATVPSLPFIQTSSALLGMNHMASFEETRRRLLKQLVGLASFALPLPPFVDKIEMHIASHEHRLDSQTCVALHQLIETCWQLCNAGRMFLAEQTLSGFLPTLIDRAAFQAEAAKLASQGLRLKSILCAHRLEISQMIPLCQQSVAYAQIGGDPNVLSAAMNGLAVAFKYNHHYTQAFEAYEAALLMSEQATPLLRSRVSAGAAATFALRGQKQEAFHLIDLAYKQFPTHPENDPFFFSADNGLFMLASYEGLLYLALDQPNNAFQAFECSQKHADTPSIPERNRLEILNHQGKAAILSNDVEQYAFCLEEGVKGALRIQSQKRLDEALTIFQGQMPRAWLTEATMKQVLEKLPLPASQV